MESVLLSITPSYINLLIQKEKSYAKQLFVFKDKIDRPLAAILTLNTFAHTLGAAGVGAQAQKIWGDASLSITSAVLTLIILIFSEIIPKTIGANYWKQLTRFTTISLLVLIYSPLYPVIVLSEFITRLFRKQGASIHEIREEVGALAHYGMQKGALRLNETRIVDNLMRFQFVRAKDIMTPRVVLLSINGDMMLSEFYHNISIYSFSRLPVFEQSEDNITGYVLKEDILFHILDKKSDIAIKEIQRPLNISVESISVFKLYEKMIENKETIQLIVDEYGVVAGLVTMEDIVETILGLEIVDETDDVVDMQEYAISLLKKRQKQTD
jgi:CBS domain containing-hemolysin-like protein